MASKPKRKARIGHITSEDVESQATTSFSTVHHDPIAQALGTFSFSKLHQLEQLEPTSQASPRIRFDTSTVERTNELVTGSPNKWDNLLDKLREAHDTVLDLPFQVAAFLQARHQVAHAFIETTHLWLVSVLWLAVVATECYSIKVLWQAELHAAAGTACAFIMVQYLLTGVVLIPQLPSKQRLYTCFTIPGLDCLLLLYLPSLPLLRRCAHKWLSDTATMDHKRLLLNYGFLRTWIIACWQLVPLFVIQVACMPLLKKKQREGQVAEADILVVLASVVLAAFTVTLLGLFTLAKAHAASISFMAMLRLILQLKGSSYVDSSWQERLDASRIVLNFDEDEALHQLPPPQQAAVLRAALLKGNVLISSERKAHMGTLLLVQGKKGMKLLSKTLTRPLAVSHYILSELKVSFGSLRSVRKYVGRVLAAAVHAGATEISVTDTHLQNDAIARVANELCQPTCRTHKLILRDCQPSFSAFSQLCEALSLNKSVTHLDLSQNPMYGGRGPAALGAMLMRNSTIERLDLNYANITSAGVKDIFSGAASCPSLKSIDLSQNRISDDVADFSSVEACNTSLTSLDMSFNWIQDGLFSWVVCLLAAFPNLKQLCLSHNSNAAVSRVNSRIGTPKARSTAGASELGPSSAAEMTGRVRGQHLAAHLHHCSHEVQQRLEATELIDLRGVPFPSWFATAAKPEALIIDLGLVYPDDSGGTNLPDQLLQKLAVSDRLVLDFGQDPCMTSLTPCQQLCAVYTALATHPHAILTNLPGMAQAPLLATPFVSPFAASGLTRLDSGQEGLRLAPQGTDVLSASAIAASQDLLAICSLQHQYMLQRLQHNIHPVTSRTMTNLTDTTDAGAVAPSSALHNQSEAPCPSTGHRHASSLSSHSTLPGRLSRQKNCIPESTDVAPLLAYRPHSYSDFSTPHTAPSPLSGPPTRQETHQLSRQGTKALSRLATNTSIGARDTHGDLLDSMSPELAALPALGSVSAQEPGPNSVCEGQGSDYEVRVTPISVQLSSTFLQSVDPGSLQEKSPAREQQVARMPTSATANTLPAPSTMHLDALRPHSDSATPHSQKALLARSVSGTAGDTQTTLQLLQSDVTTQQLSHPPHGTSLSLPQSRKNLEVKALCPVRTASNATRPSSQQATQTPNSAALLLPSIHVAPNVPASHIEHQLLVPPSQFGAAASRSPQELTEHALSHLKHSPSHHSSNNGPLHVQSVVFPATLCTIPDHSGHGHFPDNSSTVLHHIPSTPTDSTPHVWSAMPQDASRQFMRRSQSLHIHNRTHPPEYLQAGGASETWGLRQQSVRSMHLPQAPSLQPSPNGVTKATSFLEDHSSHSSLKHYFAHRFIPSTSRLSLVRQYTHTSDQRSTEQQSMIFSATTLAVRKWYSDMGMQAARAVEALEHVEVVPLGHRMLSHAALFTPTERSGQHSLAAYPRSQDTPMRLDTAAMQLAAASFMAGPTVVIVLGSPDGSLALPLCALELVVRTVKQQNPDVVFNVVMRGIGPANIRALQALYAAAGIERAPTPDPRPMSFVQPVGSSAGHATPIGRTMTGVASFEEAPAAASPFMGTSLFWGSSGQSPEASVPANKPNAAVDGNDANV